MIICWIDKCFKLLTNQHLSSFHKSPQWDRVMQCANKMLWSSFVAICSKFSLINLREKKLKDWKMCRSPCNNNFDCSLAICFAPLHAGHVWSSWPSELCSQERRKQECQLQAWVRNRRKHWRIDFKDRGKFWSDCWEHIVMWEKTVQSHMLKKTIFLWVWCEAMNGRSVTGLQRPILVLSLFTLTLTVKSTCATIAVPNALKVPRTPPFLLE